MREFARRGLAFVFAFLLIATAATSGVVPGASPVGDASAEWVDCNLTDPLLGAAFNTLTGADSGCRWQSGDVTDFENVSKTDGYASALGIKDASESYTTTTGNFLEDTRSVAWSKAKLTIVNELNNGSSAADAKAAANATIEEYYSKMQRNVFADWNSKTHTLDYIHTETGVALGPNEHTQIKEWDNKTYTLSNGTGVAVRVMDFANDGNDNYHAGPTTSVMPHSTADPGFDGGPTNIKAYDPNSSDVTLILNSGEYAGILDESYQQSTQVKGNVDQYVDGVFAEYQAGEINATSLLDPTTIASQAATEYNSTGYYSFAAVQLASLGASGDINASHTLEMGDGTTLNGTLYYTGDDAPAGGWVTGQNYTISNFSGAFYVAAQQQDGNGSIVDLSSYESFTITDAVNTRTGEALNATQPEAYVYNSTNASALESEIGRLKQLRQEYETAGSGGSSSGGGLDSQALGIALLVGAAAVLLIQREGNE
ncbi:hypothetical protein [Haloferax sp. Atlit-47N]|uniref:hypothetical protein n=1 Tax=Haloferax sp. Atlit-47N TaxID=2077199 RepID=UPI001F3B1293|nr:hypothetical protein [Haloferax sp. Atlit-47N]